MPGLFLPRSRPWLWATAAEGGLEPAPVSRFRGASPHRISSYALLGLTAFHAHGARRSATRDTRRLPSAPPTTQFPIPIHPAYPDTSATAPRVSPPVLLSKENHPGAVLR